MKIVKHFKMANYIIHLIVSVIRGVIRISDYGINNFWKNNRLNFKAKLFMKILSQILKTSCKTHDPSYYFRLRTTLL